MEGQVEVSWFEDRRVFNNNGPGIKTNVAANDLGTCSITEEG